MKRRNWFWGTFFILAAILVIASQFGVFAAGIGVWTILASVVLLSIILKSIPRRNFGGILVPLALGYMLYYSPLGWPKISLWLLLGAAILASIGLQMLIRQKPDWEHHGHVTIMGSDKGGVAGSYPQNEGFRPQAQIEYNDDDNHPAAKVKLGAASKYVHGTSVETGHFTCSMGSLEVYMDNCTLAPGGADLFMDVNLGAIELYIPRTWHVKPNVSVMLGGVELEEPTNLPPDAPVLRITGNASLGAISVKYI